MTRFSHGRWAAFLALGLAASLPGLGRSQTWVGPGTDWNTAANWSPAGVPNSATAVANFNGTGPGGVNISSGAVVNGITFSNPTGSYTLTARAAGTLLSLTHYFVGGTPVPPTITVAAAVTGTETINLAGQTTGDMAMSTYGLTINNNSTSSATTLVIGPNTVLGTQGNLSRIMVVGPWENADQRLIC